MSTILLYTLWCQGQIFPERFMSFPILYEYCPNGMQTLEPNVKFLNTKAYIYAPLKEQNIQNLKHELAYFYAICYLLYFDE